MRLREHVLRQGNQVAVDKVERGELLLYTREEWNARYRAYARGRVGLDLIALAACIVMALGLLEVLIVFAACSLLILLSLSFAYRSLTDISRGGAVPGIYSNGIEMVMYPMYYTRLFIPWDEITDSWVQRSRIRADMLFILVDDTRWRWRVPVSVLGEEGVVMVSRRTERPMAIPSLPETEPPALVLYTAEGMLTERRSGDL